MNALRNMITDLQITLAELARKIDRGEVADNRVEYPKTCGQVYVGNGFVVQYYSDIERGTGHLSAWESSEDIEDRYPGPGGSQRVNPPVPTEDSVAGMQLIAHIPSC